jgi:tetratricopeptide (TPR) repeat protein
LDFLAPGDDTPAVRSGKLVAGRFLLQGKLGSGPCGATFQGQDQATQQPVVVKLLDGQRLRAGKLPRSLKVILDLDAPSLVRPLSFGQEEGFWYFVRPWLEGETVEVRLWREPMPWAEALALFQAVIKALEPLHQAGVAHLGVSPANLLVTPQGRVQVLDAGVSYLEAKGPRLRVLPSMDLQANLAPEQVRSETADARSDLFSLGLLLHELVTGRGAFSGAYPAAALARLLLGEPPPLLQRIPTAPVWADELLASLLAKAPERRPADAAALLHALDAFRARPPVTPRLGRFGEREQRPQALLLLGGRTLVDRVDALIQAETLGKLARKAGLESVVLPDGTAMVAADPRRPLLEQLRAVARLALEQRGKFPRGPLVLAGGQGELLGLLPHGDLPDRAAALLQIEARRCKDGARGLRLDNFAAALLRRDFSPGSDDEGYLLDPEAPPAPPRAPEESKSAEDESAELAIQQARIDTLEPRHKAALRAAALLGEPSWRSGVEAILGAPVDWPSLLETGLLRPRLPPTFPGETEFEFVDSALRRALRLSLVDEDRRLGHRSAARWLERIGAPPEQIAAHLEEAQDTAQLTEFCARVAGDLLARGQPEEALPWLDRGENTGTEELGPLQALRLKALLRLGQRNQARKAAIRSLEGFPKDSEEHLSILGDLVEICGLVGDFKRLISVLERLQRQRPDPPSAAWLRAATQGAQAALRIGKFEAADALLERVAVALPSPELRGRLLLVRALRADFAGYPAASLTLRRGAVAAFRGAGEEVQTCAAEAEVALDLLGAGATFEAELLATQALQWARRMALPEVEARCKVALGLALQRGAGFELARSTVREATSFFGGRGNKLFEGEARCALASILLASSDLEGARREAERAQGALSSFPPYQLRALVLLGQTKLAQGKVEEAAQLCAQAVSLGESMAPVVDTRALLRPLQAQVAQINGQREEARQLFLEIERHLGERAAGFDDATLREAYLRHVPEHARMLQFARLFSILPPAHDDPDRMED